MTEPTSIPDDETIEIPRSVLLTDQLLPRDTSSFSRGDQAAVDERVTLDVIDPLLEDSADDIRILYVDDTPADGTAVTETLEAFDERFEVVTETTVVEALRRLEDERIHCVVSGDDLSNTDGLEFLQIVREQHSDLPFILYASSGSEQVASDAIQAGVTDYVQRPDAGDSHDVLGNRIRRAVEHYQTRAQFWNALLWYQRLVEQGVTGVFAVRDGELVFANQKFGSLLGVDSGAVVGDSLQSVLPAAASDETVASLLADDDGIVEFTARSSDGASNSLVARGAPLRPSDDLWMGVLYERDLDEESPT